MTDLAFTKITSNLDTDSQTQKVWLWDLGPTKPEPPKRPVVPKGQEGEPAYDLGMIDFRTAMEDYEGGLKAFKQAKLEYQEWHERNGGPVELLMWSCNATDALTYDPKRYCISARTRGHERLPNQGLPPGLKPGHGQAENLRRQAEGNAEALAALKADPVFGQEIRQ